ncbi:putative zinc protease [compost metagenome]
MFNDIVFHSTFPEEELEKERGVILDEIASYQDQPEEAIHDDFEDLIFKGHALGRNILGTPESLKRLKKSHIRQFIQNNYRTDQIIVAVLGNYALNKVIRIGEKYFNDIAENTTPLRRLAPTAAPVVRQKTGKPIMQAHTVLGTSAYTLHHPYKIGLLLLNNMLGGAGMSAVLNLQIREKHGIAYTIESNYSPLSDTGIFSVYFGTDKEKAEKAVGLVYKEFKKLRTQGLSETQLHKAQNRFIGQIALGEENRIGLIIAMAKSLLDYNRIDNLETVFHKIRSVQVKEIQAIANEVLDENGLSSLTFYPSA